MIEVIYDGRVPLGHTSIRRLIVNKAAVIFPGDFFSLLFKRLEIAAVFSVVDFLIQRQQFRVFFRNIAHDARLESAPQVQVFQPDRSLIPGPAGPLWKPDLKHSDFDIRQI